MDLRSGNPSKRCWKILKQTLMELFGRSVSHYEIRLVSAVIYVIVIVLVIFMKVKR